MVQALAVGGVFEDAGVAVAVGDEQVAVGGEGDVGGAVESRFGLGLLADVDSQQELAQRRKFEHAAASGVDGPDVAVGGEADGVRDFEEAFPPLGPH